MAFAPKPGAEPMNCFATEQRFSREKRVLDLRSTNNQAGTSDMACSTQAGRRKK
jgi:hypothetical protein